MSIFKKAKEITTRDRSSRDRPQINTNLGNPLNAPTEVAQATQFHQARNAGELSFKKGDFFYLTKNDQVAPDGTIEILDPIKNVKGRAPARCFKIFEKTHNSSTGDESSSSSSFPSPIINKRQISTSSSNFSPKPLGNLFGVVLYDFNAERSDELTVQTGEIIYICAHHEYEWYIAKFLNKVGEVGLVPVSYVQLIDAVTRIPFNESPKDIIEREHLPTVDEWKVVKNRHKASTKSVGPAATNSSDSISRQSSQNNSTGRVSSITRSPLKRNISQSLVLPQEVNIEYFSSTNNKFWFLVRAKMSDNTVRSLCRYYEDFFNFHQKLLSTWPREGGKYDTTKKERILPFIPGPVVDVTEGLCHKRLIDLNEYLNILLKLPDYISKSSLVLSFFDLMNGDESSDELKNTSHQKIEPLRAAPNLKIINTDRQSSQKMYQSENLSQSNFDRRSQYDPNINTVVVGSKSNRNSKVSDTTRKSSSGSIKQLINQASHLSLSSNTIDSQNQPQDSPQRDSKIKLKFYYNDDIFALSVPSNIKLTDLKSLIIPKLDEPETPGIHHKIRLISKSTDQIITSDSTLWNDPEFVDKGKFIVTV